jgi:cytochrome c oxidase assembly factor CtaG
VASAAVVEEETARRRRGQIYVALAAVAWSTAGVLQRRLTVDTPTQVFGRADLAAHGAHHAIVLQTREAPSYRGAG